MFVESCKDYSLMIRKFAVVCLTDLLIKYPSDKQLIDAWVQGVVSLAADSDVKCQDKVVEVCYWALNFIKKLRSLLL